MALDIAAVRALGLDISFTVHGVAVVVTPPDASAITTRGIWMTPTTETVPALDFSRAEMRRTMALPAAAVPSAPRGSVILAPATYGAAATHWRIDGVDREEPDHVRYFVVAAPDLDEE